MLGGSQELAGALVPLVLPILPGTFGVLEFSAIRPEDALGAVDCDSLFRHTVLLHPI